jgi:2-iminobutanoate/2-iminopropanoate deaminase
LEESQKELLKLLKEGITPATGCTEPIAVAYAVAVAKEQIQGNLESIHVQVDSNIYKNGLMVTIPGTSEKGLVAAAAFGFIAGDAKRRFRVIAGPYSQAVRLGEILFISGQLEIDPANDKLAKRVEKQTRQILENLKTILEATGYSLNNIVKTTVFIKDMNNFSVMNKIYANYFTENYPARCCVEASKIPKDGEIKIEAAAIY